MSNGMDINVEPFMENQIQEVTLDGQEIYAPSLSMSENLTKLAHKIDFHKDECEEKGKLTSEGGGDASGDEETEDSNVEPVKLQPSLWPWDSVRNKLKSAQMEMSVLYDVLNIAKEKHYMLLDHVTQDNPSPIPALQLLAKKRGLSAAAVILTGGVERLRKAASESSSGTRSQNDFHIELLHLRRNWRLKKIGKTILGDLSYRSAGSRFPHTGTFEVLINNADIAGDNVSSGSDSGSSTGSKSSLQIVVPSELEGVAYIQVEVKSVPEGADVTSAVLKAPSGLGMGIPPMETHWQKKLEAAQNVLFCRELFSQLAREAVQVRTSIPHMVIGNQIISSVFPGIQLSIVLCHFTGKDKKVASSPQKPDHNHVLEHSLHQLLRAYHQRVSFFPQPHPATATLGMSKQRRLAGPHAFSQSELFQMTECETIVEQIIKQTKHAVLKIRTMKTIDELSILTLDPQIAAHWTCLNSSTESSVQISITSVAYEQIRTYMVLQIGTESIQMNDKEGHVCHLSFEQKDLRDAILWQVSQHHVNMMVFLSKLLGWQILSNSNAGGVGPIESLGTAASVMLVLPQGHRVIALKSGPTTGLQVYVQRLPRHHDTGVPTTTSIVKDPKWSNLGGAFEEIDLTRLDGRNFVNKMELLMASLMALPDTV